MDDEALVGLLTEAMLRAPCEAVEARCQVEAQPHRFWLDVVHSDGALEPARRMVSWHTMVETSREAQVAGLSVWLQRLHAVAARHLDPTELDDGGGGRRAASDAGASTYAPSGNGVASCDGRAVDARDRVGSTRAD